ncbi:MAG: hypothetical protein FWF79_08570 [Defluviitaleaceae bacterium]|nr:hypothetical protein [Defluviitaleaceae bacterium]
MSILQFEDAMYEVLQTRRYDLLTGRRVDIRQTVEDLFERAVAWISQRFNFNLPEGTLGNASIIAGVFSLIGIVLVIIAGVVMVRARNVSRGTARYDLSDIFEEIKNYSVNELLQLSQIAETRRIAVRYKYIAAILSLNERGVIIIKPSATNAVISRQIKKSAPSLVASFGKIAETFHLAWFGHKILGDALFTEFNSAVEKLVNNA